MKYWRLALKQFLILWRYVVAAVAILGCAVLTVAPVKPDRLAVYAKRIAPHAAAATQAAAQIAPEASPEPTPAPDPAPLGIEKQPLPFAELAPTTTMAFEELAGDNGVYADETEIPPLPPSDTYKLVIDEYWQFATAYARDETGEYTIPVRYMIVTTGASDTPTPKGTFSMGGRFVRFGYFSVGYYGQYWRQVTGAIYTHSLLYLHRNANSYTNSYTRLGRRGSHGCVRLMVPDARWIYYSIAPGTLCEIIPGDQNDEAAAAVKAQLVFAEKPNTRPGLKPGEIPVTEAWPGWPGNAYDAYQVYIAAQATSDESDTVSQG